MISKLPLDLLQYELSEYLPLSDMLSLQHAMPRTAILNPLKKLYQKVQSLSRQSKKVSRTRLGRKLDLTQFEDCEKFETVFEGDTIQNIRDYPLNDIPKSIATRVEIIVPENTTMYMVRIEFNCMQVYEWGWTYNENGNNIILPIPVQYMDARLIIAGNVTVKLSGYRVSNFTFDSTRITGYNSRFFPKSIQHVNNEKETPDHFYLDCTKFGKKEMQLLWNMCKKVPRRPFEMALPCNLNLNDGKIHFYNFYSRYRIRFGEDLKYTPRIEGYNVLMYHEGIIGLAYH